MSAARPIPMSEFSLSHFRDLGKEAYSKIEETFRLGGFLKPGAKEIERAKRFPNSLDRIEARKDCSDSDNRQEITLNVFKSEQLFLSFALNESGEARRFRLENPTLVIGGEKILLDGTLCIDGVISKLGVSDKDRTGNTRLGIQLVEWIKKSADAHELQPLNLELLPHIFLK